MPLRARALVSGRVQGVWFRESTREACERLGVQGWVRNLADGRVEALFEGEAAAVEAALRFVHQGPPASSVLGVDVEREDIAATTESGFRVRRS